jgi:Na+/proline symporter
MSKYKSRLIATTRADRIPEINQKQAKRLALGQERHSHQPKKVTQGSDSTMVSYGLLAIIVGYFLLLLALAWVTSRRADNESFFIGNRKSNWMLVAFGMVGTSLSGVTFISVPGTVGSNGFGYLQVVIGNWIGFMLIAGVLLPLYYRLKLTSIYDYLDQRFGVTAHKTGALFFILSRTLGATARLYLVVNVLHILVGAPMGIPFWLTTGVILLMIWLYTHQGGVKTIVFTDTLQTACMLGGLLICVYFLAGALGLNAGGVAAALSDSPMTRLWNTDPNAAGFWLKQIVGGAFIAIAMTGLDQEMMQKNISVPNLRDSQKNMFVFSLVLIFVNVLFLVLGALLFLFAAANNVSAVGDQIFPSIVMQYFPFWIQAIFFLALISALFPSADGALTALTASWCIDILGIRKRALPDSEQTRIRRLTHIIFALVFFAIVMIFKLLDDRSIIDTILKIAGYTYGPLLGLFAFGMLTKRALNNGALLVGAALASPVACYLLQRALAMNPAGYQIGIELMLINGALTFGLLWLASSKPATAHAVR